MKKLIFIAFALALLANNAFAALGDVMASFELTFADPAGAAVSNEYVYYISRSVDKVVILDRANGSVVNTWICPFPFGNRGLAYSWGGNLWLGSAGNDLVYQCDSQSGWVINYWTPPHHALGLAPYCMEDGGMQTIHIISYNPDPNTLLYHDEGTGSVAISTSLADADNCDMAYDWRNNLIWKQNSGRDQIYGMHYLTGSLITSFPSPCAEGFATGLAYTDYSLYIVCADCWMYQVECPEGIDSGDTAVTPASMGKVKAMFH
jgi:hypothetical protein